VNRPANPSKSGSTFNGWYLDGAPYDFNTPVNADITLTAAWNYGRRFPEPKTGILC
jgi:uncharacterized repeat protein (TIGR02543 family)